MAGLMQPHVPFLVSGTRVAVVIVQLRGIRSHCAVRLDLFGTRLLTGALRISNQFALDERTEQRHSIITTCE